MKVLNKLRWHPVPLLFILWGLFGCGASPATAPAPLAEIPSAVEFPNGSIDVSSVSSGVGGSIKFLQTNDVATIVGPGGEFSFVIAQGPDTVDILTELLDGFLAPLNAAQIPVSPTVITFNFTTEDRPGIENQDYKFDFRPFDYDSDGPGTPEDCAGSTCPVSGAIASCPTEAPLTDLKKVCFRIWRQRAPDLPFERFMAGVFDFLPIPDNPATLLENEANAGKGSFTLGSTQPGGDFGPDTETSLFSSLLYDHRDPSNMLNLFTDGSFNTKVFKKDGALIASSATHDFVDQVALNNSGDPKQVKKTIKTTFEGFEAPEASESGEPFTSNSNYIGRFREDLDYWSGSFFAQESGSEDVNVPTTCASRTSGDGASNDICVDIGIDTTGDATLAPAANISFPSPTVFPLLPTF